MCWKDVVRPESKTTAPCMQAVHTPRNGTLDPHTQQCSILSNIHVHDLVCTGDIVINMIGILTLQATVLGVWSVALPNTCFTRHIRSRSNRANTGPDKRRCWLDQYRGQNCSLRTHYSASKTPSNANIVRGVCSSQQRHGGGVLTCRHVLWKSCNGFDVCRDQEYWHTSTSIAILTV